LTPPLGYLSERRGIIRDMLKVTKAQVMHLLAAPISMAAGWLATVIGNAVPGVHLTSGWLAGIFTVGMAGAYTLAVHYLHGWQWWERHVSPLVDVTATTVHPPPPEPPPPAPVRPSPVQGETKGKP
jgi:hypothetical protein